MADTIKVNVLESCPAPMGEGMYTPQDSPVEVPADHYENIAAYVEPAGSGDAEPTKEELYRRAQELEIEGRSDMTKAELADAVQAAE